METWGLFGIAHMISWPIAAGIIFALYFLIRKRSEKTQRIVLGILSFSGIAAIIYNLLEWGTPLEYLPLHLCSINAILLPIAIFTKNKESANQFIREIKSSHVYLNTSPIVNNSLNINQLDLCLIKNITVPNNEKRA